MIMGRARFSGLRTLLAATSPSLPAIVGGCATAGDPAHLSAPKPARPKNVLFIIADDIRDLAYDPKYAAVVAKLREKLPLGDVGPMRGKTLANGQGTVPKGQPRSRPVVEGCENLERLIG